MNPITIQMMVKASHPMLTASLLAAVGVAIAFIVCMLLRHVHRTRKAKQSGQDLHDGHHGNH
jgi:hypothetical protein